MSIETYTLRNKENKEILIYWSWSIGYPTGADTLTCNFSSDGGVFCSSRQNIESLLEVLQGLKRHSYSVRTTKDGYDVAIQDEAERKVYISQLEIVPITYNL